MSRLGEALHELDDPPVGAIVIFNSQPGRDLARRAPRPRGPPARRPLHGRARAADDRHRRPRGRRPAGDDAAGARRLPRLLRPPLPVVERAGRAAARRVPAELRDHPPDRGPPRLRPSGAAAVATSSSRPRCSAPAGVDFAQLRASRDSSASARRAARRRSRTAASRPPSGRVELFSPGARRRGQRRAADYVPPFEAVDDELAERFPLVLLAPAGRFFLNSTFAQLGLAPRQDGAADAVAAPGRRRPPRPRRRRRGARASTTAAPGAPRWR